MISDQDLLKYSPNVPTSDFIYHVNISIAHKYMYVETPKVGCSSVKSLLIRAELEQNFDFGDDQVHLREISPLLNPRQVGIFSEFLRKEIFKFCFVRNPYSRLLSSYLNKIALPDSRRYNIARRIDQQLGISDARPVTFAEFVGAVTDQTIEAMDPHWRVQYYQTFQDTVRYDFVGRLETFVDDLAFVCRQIGIDFDKWYRREATQYDTNADDRLGNFYTRELKNAVYLKYKMDFDHFGYPA
jgi:dermatan 4-sulfotransferase 1